MDSGRILIQKYLEEIEVYCIGEMSEEQRQILETILKIVYARGLKEGMEHNV